MSYQSEKLAAARSALMLPHVGGEAASIATCFFECSNALNDLDRSKLTGDKARWVAELDKIMNRTGLSDPNKEGLFTVRARSLTVDEQADLSRLVDALEFEFRD
ncbi:hypothetical protein LP415_19275 [Polaromonas sp. P1(28)-8]|nr:hypothetical protein LP415_19275 [Polaromonas sp. P1(28)-8]